MTKEVEAESVAFCVCQYFGLDTSDYSFPYISGWSSSREMSELRTSMDTVRKTAGDLIETIGEEFRELLEEREAEHIVSPEQLFMESEENVFAIYQITDNSRNRQDMFVDMDFLKLYGRKVDALGYQMIYQRKMNLKKPETLDSLWLEFNTDHPKDYEGRSLSISDVVVMKQDGDVRAYFTDRYGFTELPYFVQEREKYLHRKEEIRDSGVITEKSMGISVEQHEGTWKTVEVQEFNAQKFYYMEHDEYETSVASVVLDGNGELVAQDIELLSEGKSRFDDVGVMMAIREYFTEKEILIIDYKLEFDTNQPDLVVYRFDYAYAKEHGELDQHRQSYEKNVQCKNAIEKAVAENFDGMRLNEKVLNPIIEQYGMERVGYILAFTVVMKDYDGRFSVSNKFWANEQHTAEDFDLYKNDRRQDFMIDSHPAVLDGVVNIYRSKVREQEKTVEEKATLTFYVAEYMEFPVLGEYHNEIQTAEEAVKFYEAIPTDRINGVKGIGFDLQDGSIYEGEYLLMEAGVIDMDAINHIEHYKNSPLVQQAIEDLSKAMPLTFRQTPEQQENVEKIVAEQVEPSAVSEPGEEPVMVANASRTDKGTSKRESILQALKERQSKLKTEESSKDKEQQKSKEKKGDLDL